MPQFKILFKSPSRYYNSIVNIYSIVVFVEGVYLNLLPHISTTKTFAM